MTQPGEETVPPSDDPDAATATGTGGASPGATAPPPAEQSAGTGGVGTEADRQAHGGPPPGDAPYDLSPGKPDDQDTAARSDSGT
jgi:hypothetical protein